MKKLISVAAFLAASTALASAATETVNLFTDATTGTLVWKNKDSGATNLSGIDSSSAYVTVTSSDISLLLTTQWGNVQEGTGTFYVDSGWYLGTGAGTALNGFPASDWALSSSDGTATFKTNTRPAYKSQYVAFVYNLSDLTLSGSYTSVDSLNLSLSYTTTENSAAQITLWYANASNNITSLATGSASSEGTTISGTIGYETDGKIIALFSNSSTSVATTYSGVSLTASIPEPSAFGLLAGAGALALVAARRRRRAK